MGNQLVESNEVQLPDTVFVRDIESRVFQSIALECLAKIEGIALMGANIIDSLLGRDPSEIVKGIHVDQDQKNHSVNLRVELNIAYGLSIPEKADEVQTKVSEDITRLTGLHVGSVHVVFKNLIPKAPKQILEEVEEEEIPVLTEEEIEE